MHIQYVQTHNLLQNEITGFTDYDYQQYNVLYKKRKRFFFSNLFLTKVETTFWMVLKWLDM